MKSSVNEESKPCFHLLQAIPRANPSWLLWSNLTRKHGDRDPEELRFPWPELQWRLEYRTEDAQNRKGNLSRPGQDELSINHLVQGKQDEVARHENK